MLRIDAGQLGIEQGSLMLFSDFEDGGEMWAGTGERELRRVVRFSTPFHGAPVVTLGVSLWDFDHATNHRADLQAQRVAPEGFELVFRTWKDTRVARLRVDWAAFGAVPGPDLWDL